MWHIQRTVPGWLESVKLLPDGALVKTTENQHLVREVKGINQNIYTAFRMVRDSWQVYQGTRDSGWFNWEAATGMARDWFLAFVNDTFRQEIAQYCDGVSWHNEIWANSQNEVEWAERVAASEAAVHVWNTEFRPTLANDVRLIIGEAAVGNNMPRRIAELAIESDNLLGYHPYEWWTRKVRSGEGFRAATSMLWDTMEFNWGLKPTWIFTENGPLESAVTGWRASECLDGNRLLYVEAVRLWMADVAQTPAYKEGRVRGFSLFTTFHPADNQWGSFHTGQPEMNELATMIAKYWKPGTAPPPPTNTFKSKAWTVTVNMQKTGQDGIRLNAKAGIQEQIAAENLHNNNDLQVVTSETIVDGKTVQAAESLTHKVPRRVYVWEAGQSIWWFEDG